MSIKETIQAKFTAYRAAGSGTTDSQEKLDCANLFAEFLGGYIASASDFEVPVEEIKAATVALRVVESDIEKINSEYELQELLR